MTADKPLLHRKILVTRPQGLHHKLCQLITDAGGDAIHYAAIEITGPADNSSREHARRHFGDYDIAIFISPTAVKTTLQYMPVDDVHCQLAAIGSRSQQALEQAGLKVSIQPQGHDSESLLRHPALQSDRVQHKNIVIFRGEDGRDILADSLRARGANVDYAAMYSRICPHHSQPLDTAFITALDAITVSSNEGLQNLYQMAQRAGADVTKLKAVSLFVPGQRARKLAQTLGFEHVVQADNATDDAMFAALVDTFSTCR